MPANLPYISPEQLCVGLYIQLDLSWWEHSFAFSNFKIKDESQLKQLRALGLKRLRYDPARSDCDPLPLAEAPVEQPAAPPPPPDPQEQARQARVKQLSVLRKRLSEVDRAFVQASQRVKALNQSLRNQPEESVKQAGALVNELVTTMLGEDGVALHSINGKAAEDAYLHSLNVTVLSMMLGRQLGLDAEASHMLGMGALLHDIGKLELPSKVLLKPPPLTRAEQQLLEMHTLYGKRMGEKLMLDDDVLRIIHEHHEHCDGSGYPQQLREASIGRLSRIVCIANHFDNLCNPVDPRTALSPHEALARMFLPQYRVRFDDVALKAFIRCMGVYPPGSLVQLEDERYALVLGMHPTLPMKPTLIIYDPAVPKEEALIVNLEAEPKLAIAASIRPSQLPSEALEYLNPRQQLTYYVDPRRR
ncbi:HD family phosphohydrolase [Pseudomonas straminea]|uniref:HDIG domain-containing protein n=1 Tax=Pseudomonas straminea TaxID=47882 RepID=A0A1I1XWB3_PSEOC|nr:HD-GYP domain-containing protein [Pseudomonas straminea]GLX15548.1 HD family phosphohydrolase [Pseudomonas straminea]SFE11542.1 HDIG domain-containing protein [Pseudomonas straminea]